MPPECDNKQNWIHRRGIGHECDYKFPMLLTSQAEGIAGQKHRLKPIFQRVTTKKPPYTSNLKGYPSRKIT